MVSGASDGVLHRFSFAPIRRLCDLKGRLLNVLVADRWPRPSRIANKSCFFYKLWFAPTSRYIFRGSGPPRGGESGVSRPSLSTSSRRFQYDEKSLHFTTSKILCLKYARRRPSREPRTEGTTKQKILVMLVHLFRETVHELSLIHISEPTRPY